MKKAEAISILATSVRPREAKDRARYDEAVRMAIEALKRSETPNSSDCISRQAAIDLFPDDDLEYDTIGGYIAPHLARRMICELPFAQPDHVADISKKVSISCAHENDVISRKAAIEALARMMPRSYTPDGSHPADEEIFRAQEVFADCIEALEIQPSAQPERTCVNCGRTVNNGGWYADGGTRCPIEEHYALPKDGYCHLWEERNVTDDDYPERREE